MLGQVTSLLWPSHPHPYIEATSVVKAGFRCTQNDEPLQPGGDFE